MPFNGDSFEEIRGKATGEDEKCVQTTNEMQPNIITAEIVNFFPFIHLFNWQQASQGINKTKSNNSHKIFSTDT